ncbi:OmpA family protein [Colwellia sp. 20A7]|uniref:OmpA family protein n=1 Tax=Colwellia sp. 20A7 TaxID=2689569 RepID=UPI00135BF5FF|nr:OmpA family protein [Colwellia sp. 20A7]
MKSEYSIFSVALIDLFASAMMAFMILTFMLLPKISFTSTIEAPSDKVDIAGLKQTISSKDAQIEALAAQLAQAKAASSSDSTNVLSQVNAQMKKQLSAVKSLYKEDYSMNLPLMFDGNQWYIRPENVDILNMMGRETAINGAKVTLIGHTSGEAKTKGQECLNLDEHGDVKSSRVKSIAPIGQVFKRCFRGKEWNYFLSERRANSIKEYLIAKYPIESERIQVFGFGSDEHLTGMAADDSRNRRVEIKYEVE